MKIRKAFNITLIFILIRMAGFVDISFSEGLRVPIDREYGRMKTVVALENGKFLLKRVVKLTLLDPEDREKFGKALLKMSRLVSDHKLILTYYADLILKTRDSRLTEIYAAIDEMGEEWNILALQIVNFKDSKGEEAILSTWIKPDNKIGFVANQILAFAINDLLNRGVEKVDSSKVDYTQRVRKVLPKGINDVAEMKKFLQQNAAGVLNASNIAGENLSNSLILRHSI